MRAYLQRAMQYSKSYFFCILNLHLCDNGFCISQHNFLFHTSDEFMEQQTHEYNIGKRHLANMMGADPETFTQQDIDVSLLFICNKKTCESPCLKYSSTYLINILSFVLFYKHILKNIILYSRVLN